MLVMKDTLSVSVHYCLLIGKNQDCHLMELIPTLYFQKMLLISFGNLTFTFGMLKDLKPINLWMEDPFQNYRGLMIGPII